MAKLVLTIQPKDEGALKSVQALKAEVQSLSKSLSAIKINSSGVETTRKGYANLITTLKTLKSQYADGVFGNLPQDAERAFKKIQEISAALQENGKLTKEQAKAYAQLSQQLKKFSADLATVKAKNDKIVAANPFTVTQAQQIPRLIKQYSTLLNHIKSIEKYYPNGTFDTFKADLTEGTTQLQGLNQEYQTTQTLTQGSQDNLNNLANGFLQVNAAVAQTTSTMKSSKGSLIDIVAGFAKFQISAMAVMKPLQMIRSALTSINETLVKTEDAVIALQRVLPTGSATDDEISSRLYKVAQDYGQTFENVSQIATNFARTGMSWADTIKATEAAVLALNVAELDATEASEGLISILTQFEMTADQLTEVVDKLNKAADKNPVTTEKLLTALQRTGAAAQNANITLDETIGIITTLSKATNRSGENLGTAVNSLIQFSSKESSLDTFAKFGGDVETAVEKFRAGAGSILEIWEELGEVIQNRQGEAESILGGGLFNNEEWASLNDELKEALGESYADVTDIYNTASVFRRNYFVALLNDMDNVKKVTDDIADANGYSQAENEKALQTYTKRLNSLKAQWEDIANSEQGLLGIKKALVDVGSVLLTIIKWTGGLRTTLLAISTVVWALVGNKILAGLKSIGTAIKGLITGLFTAQKAAEGLHAALGVLGIVAIVISSVVGVVEQFIEKEEEAKKAAVEYWQSIEEQAYRLEELSDKYASLTSGSEEYEEVEQSIVDLLGTKAIRLAGLTKGTEEYRKQVEVLTGELKKNNRAAAQAAANAAKDLFNKTTYSGVGEYTVNHRVYKDKSEEDLSNSDTKYTELFNALEKEGFVVNRRSSGGSARGYNWVESFAQLGLTGNPFEDEQILDKAVQFLLENGYGESDFYNTIYKAWEERNTAIEDYLKSYAPSYGYEDISDNEGFDEIVDSVMVATGATENWRSTIEGIIRSVSGYKEAQEGSSEETKKQTNNLQDQVDAYDDLIAKLKELRDAEKENLDLEEKKKDYLEAQNELIKAQRALENARNEATVRRFNEATGQWEWQVDEKKVAEAEEDVKKQEENLENSRKDLEEQAYDTIIDQLENKTATNDGLNALLDGLKDYLGEDFITAIKAAILEIAGVDLDKPQGGTSRGGGVGAGDGDGATASARSYDSGGAAIGKGFMPKATDEIETVNGPDLTAKILSPVSNAHFDRWVHDMGVLFETSRQYAQTPVVERVGSNTDNSVNNSGQIIMNGVSIGSDKRTSSLDEILVLGGMVPNE